VKTFLSLFAGASFVPIVIALIGYCAALPAPAVLHPAFKAHPALMLLAVQIAFVVLPVATLAGLAGLALHRVIATNAVRYGLIVALPFVAFSLWSAHQTGLNGQWLLSVAVIAAVILGFVAGMSYRGGSTGGNGKSRPDAATKFQTAA